MSQQPEGKIPERLQRLFCRESTLLSHQVSPELTSIRFQWLADELELSVKLTQVTPRRAQWRFQRAMNFARVMSSRPLKTTSTMRPLIAVAAGLSLAGILIALTMGVFMEINIGIPTLLFSSRAIKTTASPQTQSATPSAKFVTITQSVSVGGTVLPAGTRLEFLSKADADVLVRYKDGEYAIPISATDLNSKRAHL